MLKNLTRMPAPFGEQVDIVPGLDEMAMAKALRSSSNPSNHPVFQETFRQILEAATLWGRYGDMYEFNENGEFPRLVIPPVLAESYYRQLTEEGGIRPDHTPSYFDQPMKWGGTVDLTPDFTYLLWMRSTTMTDEIEDRKEWDFNPQYVLMKEAGQIKFGTWASQEMSMRNDEFGAGVNISWTWFETNKFRIKFANLAPKFKYQYFDDIATAIYDGVASVFTNTLATHGKAATNRIITDLNQSYTALMRWTNYNGKAIWESASFTVLAPPEFQEYLDAALRMSAVNPASSGLLKRPQVIYTPKLPAASPNTIYVVVTKEEQNEYATRVPLTAHGPVDDIRTFSSMIAYRGAYGANLNVNSAIALTFDPTAADFAAYGPVYTMTVTP